MAQQTNSNAKLRSLCYTALMIALVFIFTFTFKIPLGSGYAHLGDMFIIVSAWLLGTKRAPIAAALGASLADLAGGYAIWILPTFLVKFAMALTICLIAEKIFHQSKTGYVVGCIVGAIVHIIGYEIAYYFILGGMGGVIAAFVPLLLQTVVGLVLGLTVVTVLSANKAGQRLKAAATN